MWAVRVRWKGGYGTARAVTQQSEIDRIRNEMQHIRIGVIWVLDGCGGGTSGWCGTPLTTMSETHEGLV